MRCRLNNKGATIMIHANDIRFAYPPQQQQDDDHA
jgi:hypothetical protein